MAKKLITRGAFLVVAAALLCGLLHALPWVGASAQPASLISASRGVANQQGVTLGDRLAAWLWNHGGEGSLALGQIADHFIFWTALSLFTLGLSLIIGKFLPARFRNLPVSLVLLGLTVNCGLALWDGYTSRPARTQPVLLSAPLELAELAGKQPSGTVYSSASALPYLVLYAPGSTGSLDPNTAINLTTNPEKWREALRKAGWRSIVLSGTAAETQPLLDHLLSSPDWRLAVISNQGYFFTREKGPQPPVFDPEKIKLATQRDTAIYLAQIAERLDALRRLGESRDAIAKALDYAPRDVEVLVHAASLHAAHKRWQDAITYCDRALQADSRHLYARLLKALALVETGRPEVAESEARRVLNEQPTDPYTLFLYARICRMMHDYRREAETLEKLIDLTKAGGRPVPAGYYIFLGQAYAKNSDAEEALRAYRAALASPDMPPQMAVEVKDSVETIEKRKSP